MYNNTLRVPTDEDRVPTDEELLAVAHGYRHIECDRRNNDLLAAQDFNRRHGRFVEALFEQYPSLRNASVEFRKNFLRNQPESPLSSNSSFSETPSEPFYNCRVFGHEWEQTKKYRRCKICDERIINEEIGDIPELVEKGVVRIRGLLDCLAVYVIHSENGIIDSVIAGHFVCFEMMTSRGLTNAGKQFFSRMKDLISEEGWEISDLYLLISKSHIRNMTKVQQLSNFVDWGWKNIICGSCPEENCSFSVGDQIDKKKLGTIDLTYPKRKK